jgi:hypothetical protein
MGNSGRVSRNNLAHANETRDWRISVDFAQALIDQAKKLYAKEDFGVEAGQIEPDGYAIIVGLRFWF